MPADGIAAIAREAKALLTAMGLQVNDPATELATARHDAGGDTTPDPSR
jgi:hypothetical protein